MVLSKSDIATLTTTTTTLCDDEDFNDTLTVAATLTSLLGCAPKEEYKNTYLANTYMESLSNEELNNSLEIINRKENELNNRKIFIKRK